jgi:hypothetical protein
MGRLIVGRPASSRARLPLGYGSQGWFAGWDGRRYNGGMQRSPQPDRLAITLMLTGALLLLVPCVLGAVALVVFGWPMFVTH